MYKSTLLQKKYLAENMFVTELVEIQLLSI